MITLRTLALALRTSFAARDQEELERERFIAEKRRQQAETDAAWQEELKRREERRIDADGIYAAERAEREEEREEEQLADMTAMLLRRQKRG